MEIVTKIAPIALALIMLGLGLGLTTQDFTRVLKTPKDFLIGFVSQLIILPIVAFVLIKILANNRLANSILVAENKHHSYLVKKNNPK